MEQRAKQEACSKAQLRLEQHAWAPNTEQGSLVVGHGQLLARLAGRRTLQRALLTSRKVRQSKVALEIKNILEIR